MSSREAILKQIRKVPAIPVAATEVLTLLQDPDVKIGQLRRKIEFDPGLASNVLKLANSAAFGGAGSVSSIQAAIVRVGIRQLARLVTASAVAPVVRGEVRGYGVPAGGLWEHSASVALGVEALAEVLKVKLPEVASTAALLHDVGKMVLSTFVQVDAAPIAKLAFEKRVSFEEAEREVLGIDHAEAGAELLASWNLPDAVVEVVRWHHQPGKDAGERLALDLVNAADHVSIACGIGRGDADGLHYRPSSQVVSRLKLTTGAAEMVACRMLTGLDELRELFGAGGGR